MIKKFLMAAVTLFAFSGWASAQQEVSFSTAFVDPAGSGAGKVRIGGISVTGVPTIFSVDFGLRADYTLAITNGSFLTSDQEVLEQSLRNSTWTGVYSISGIQYATTLTIAAAQGGYVGGEIRHINPGNSSDHMTARLAGEIIKQFTLNGVLVDEDNLTAAQKVTVANLTPAQYVIRIKRVRGVDYGVSNWGTNREYRLVLNGKALSGICSTPAELYGQSSSPSDNGTITVTRQ